MTVKRFNNAHGVTNNAPLASGDTTLNSDELSRLGVVDNAAGEFARVTLDKNRVFGEPEIIHVTDYDGSATTATIERGKEGSTAREHPQGTSWWHGPTVQDFADVDGGTL